jgi:predicted RNase H-like nuclease (RuvC/YqgF family)
MAGERVSAEADQLRERIAELESELERLEKANRELRRANVRLAEARVAKLDSAAASALQRERPGGPGFGRRLRGGIRARPRAVALRILR